MKKKFQKRKEDFVCGFCGTQVAGTGYTNHCPRCLYSQHVDVNPGDRAAECGGLMKVVEVEFVDGEYVFIHECVKCGHRKRNTQAANDDLEVILQAVQKLHKEKGRM
ncbi:MAG: hypothetical protein A3F54_03800 [Candidatus Kerfeldbacteria bacterium RIFCSPHIGHO2_12_FULL_48_17]|uniref:RNHCP domain-containing protein n=1 Tax=Candidatus Kerfeldbacteria bacterium RIFCSPHIGHO2_12_FULL_48_17 TaxID=1798542 RepID=A0A1G2B4S7_9BACT|nr:MAG: hypothetical protein A3F54_03800 [Candidatus Kerfeldbacteria bacterium RIFCSPHIGHO2_12_FULL_48_17]